MPKKWELAVPSVLEYLDNNKGCYISDMQHDLCLSKYIIKTALEKLGCLDRVNYGLSPKTKAIRDKKISKTVKQHYLDGDWRVTYDEEWKQKCKDGIAAFQNDPIRKSEAYQKRDITCREKYGQDYRQKFYVKSCETKLERYNDCNFSNPDKVKRTKLQKYGDENYNNRAKAAETNFRKYGGTGNASNELLTKYENTCTERYGVKTNLISDDKNINGYNSIIQKFGSRSNMYRHIQAKGKKTKLEIYGDEFFHNPEKAKQTMVQKYGVEYFVTSPICRKSLSDPVVIEKRFKTMKNNESYHKSEPEDQYYKYLKSFYSESDVIRQYKDERYPYACDFYIKPLDIFVECNFHWTHGPHPYDPNSGEDAEILKTWKSKSVNSKFYSNAIYVWTVLDIQKVKTARKNNIELISVYNGDNGYVYFRTI